MRRWQTDNRRRARIEIIPMIDVMLFLLVFFVLISINVVPAFSIKTRLPLSTSASSGAERHNAIVSLGRNGELQLDGRTVSAEEMLPRLLALRQAHPQLAVIISGDQAVELQRLIDVMDKLRSAGFQSMSISARKAAPS